MNLFVSVGTLEFKELIDILNKQETIDALKIHKIKKVYLALGRFNNKVGKPEYW